jgi:hypothetical protein
MNKPNDEKPLTNVALYIRGKDLIPDQVTRVLMATPTSAWTRGDEFKSKSGLLIRKQGMWCVENQSDDRSISDHFEDLLKKIPFRGNIFTEIQNVDTAEFSVFSCGTPDKNGDFDLDFHLDSRIWNEIAIFGVDVSFSIGAASK